MIGRNPELLERLAQRYVIGIQHGAARRRFERLARAHFDVRDRVEYWEARMTPLAWSLAPETPSPLVWQRIRGELAFAGPAFHGSGVRRRWIALAASFALVAMIAGGGWWQAATQPPDVVTETVIERVTEPVSVAIVSNEGGDALWFVRLLPDSGRLSVRVVNEPEARPRHDYQLWLLAADGSPLSLGLLPQSGEKDLPLDDAAVQTLDESRMVAVSLEPPGGSPRAVPTGPVLFTAALLAP